MESAEQRTIITRYILRSCESGCGCGERCRDNPDDGNVVRMRIIVTVDTEADDQWNRARSLTIENVFALDRFQNLCERYAMPPTYLLTHEVAVDARAAEQFRVWQKKGAEIGSHLHPWTTPPLSSGEDVETTFPSELSDGDLRAKLVALTEVVAKVSGGAPTSYRAGRWGFDSRQANLLKEMGYTVDLSITPGLSWKDTKGKTGGPGGPDFTSESPMPHFLNENVLEVPMTILRVGLLRRLRWLRIFENTTVSQLRAIVRTAKRKKLPAIVFMTHSSELTVGKSPYVKTPEALEHAYECIEGLFDICSEEGVTGQTASAFASEFQKV